MRIEPTVSRMVWFYPAPTDSLNKGRGLQPLSGQIAHVNDNGTVNLLVLSAMAGTHPVLGVPLAQSSEESKDFQAGGTAHCVWMPYQKGQAAREAQQAERSTGEVRGGLHAHPPHEPGHTYPPVGEAAQGDPVGRVSAVERHPKVGTGG